eukprot:1087748-Rhodomonas_salina.3
MRKTIGAVLPVVRQTECENEVASLEVRDSSPAIRIARYMSVPAPNDSPSTQASYAERKVPKFCGTYLAHRASGGSFGDISLLALSTS